MKRLSFITQFKIEFLLLFTGCRKVLRKILDYYFYTLLINHDPTNFKLHTI